MFVIATTTFYKDESSLRCRLTMDIGEKGGKAGVPLIVLEGSPTILQSIGGSEEHENRLKLFT